jgi:hypothetical protein
LDAASAIAPPAPAIATPLATSGTFALLATLPTVWPAPPTAFRTASTGLLPPLEPLLDPFELGALAFEPDDLLLGLDDLELADFGFARLLLLVDLLLLVAWGFADFGFAAFELDFAFEPAFGFDCDFAFGFDLLDEAARFGADRFLGLVSAIFLSPLECPYWSEYPIHWRQITLRAAKST